MKPKTTFSFVEQRIPIKITNVELGRVDVEPEKELEPGEYAVVLRPRWQSKEVSDKDIRVFSAAASYFKDGKRVTAWSDTSEFAQSSQLIGFRTQYSEIKLTERFIKALRKPMS